MRYTYLLLFLISSIAFSQQLKPVAHWSFDGINRLSENDFTGTTSDSVLGYTKFVEGVSGKALKFDPRSTFIIRNKNLPELNGNGFTFEAWIAQQSYPLNWAPLIEQYDELNGFFFGVDSDGRFGLHIKSDGTWYEYNTRPPYPGYGTYHTWNSDSREWELHGIEKDPPEPLKGKGDPVLELLKWNHVAVVFEAGKGIELYLNGKLESEFQFAGKYIQSETPLYIGRGTRKMMPAHTERFYGTEPVIPAFDGIMDELKIYDYPFSEAEIESAFKKFIPVKSSPLNFRKLPTGPKGKGNFGAYYTYLKYDENFDRYFRMRKVPDVVVTFDNFPFKLVCWHGLNYYPVWYAENDIGIMHEAVETWGHLGTHESMMDKQVRYANVRILENSDARVVLHYRHAVNNMAYELIHEDSTSGWHDWCDEILTIYPDGVAARNLIHWCSYLDLKGKDDNVVVENFVEETDKNGNLIVADDYDNIAENQENEEDPEKVSNNSSLGYTPQPHTYEQDNFIVPIGKTPSDILNKEAGIHANMKGEESNYTWEVSGRPRGKKIENPNIVVYNIKADSKPFMIVPSEAAEHFFEGNGKPWPNSFYWWDHWPVSQLKSDGKQLHLVNGRPSSSCIGSTAFKLDTTVFNYDNQSISVYSLLGMGMNLRAGDLLPLAKSWQNPPVLKIVKGNVVSEGYSKEERCYNLISLEKNQEEIVFEIDGNDESPLVNLPIVIKDWGDDKVGININEGQSTSKVRTGYKSNLDRPADLILFVEIDSKEKVTLSIKNKSLN